MTITTYFSRIHDAIFDDSSIKTRTTVFRLFEGVATAGEALATDSKLVAQFKAICTALTNFRKGMELTKPFPAFQGITNRGWTIERGLTFFGATFESLEFLHKQSIIDLGGLSKYILTPAQTLKSVATLGLSGRVWKALEDVGSLGKFCTLALLGIRLIGNIDNIIDRRNSRSVFDISVTISGIALVVFGKTMTAGTRAPLMLWLAGGMIYQSRR